MYNGGYGLEVKTADFSQKEHYDFSDLDNPQIPQHYYMQCQWYAGLANVDRWDFIVGFFRGDKMVSHEICSYAFVPELYEFMVEEAVKFWEEHVEARNPPDDASPAETERFYRRKYPRHIPKTFAERTEISDGVVARMRRLADDIKAKELEYDLDKAWLIAHLADNEALETSIGNVTYKAAKDSETTDWKKYAEFLEKHITGIDNAWDDICDKEKIIIPFDESTGSLYEHGIGMLRNKFTTTKPGSRRLLLPRGKE
jgi:predicted phage-related endonuclease